MKIEVFSTTLLLLLYGASSLNILAIFPYQGRSHFIVYEVFLKALVERGHNLTVISHFPQKNAPANYHDISLAGTLQEISATELPLRRTYVTISAVLYLLASEGKTNCEVMLANKQVQDLVKNKQKFDLVIMELFNSDCGLGIAHKLGAPVVGTTSFVMMPFHYDRLGIPSNPSFVSYHFLEGGTKPSLFQRVERVLINFIAKNVYYWVSQRNNQNALAQYFGDVPPLEDLAREIKVFLLYHNFALTGSRLFPANVFEVGGYHVQKAKSLTGNLKKFVEEAEHGVIYISFGTLVQSTSLPHDKIQAILDAIHELPQRFIWKWENKTLPADKNKVYIDSWLPQVDILSHPKTVAFFSHAGLGGTTEALTFGVPIVAMPIIGDQPSNAAAIVESGLGVQLQYDDLTKENLVAAFKKILDPKFQKQAKEVSQTWHDRPMAPLDTAIFWTEFVARHPNIHLRTPAADVPFYQYFCLDVIGVILVFVFILAKAFTLLCCQKKKENIPEQKKTSKKRTKRE